MAAACQNDTARLGVAAVCEGQAARTHVVATCEAETARLDAHGEAGRPWRVWTPRLRLLAFFGLLHLGKKLLRDHLVQILDAVLARNLLEENPATLLGIG